MSLTVGSLFSGIGGLDLGLERAGMKVIWQSEIDPYCCKVLKKHWPEVPNYGNIKEINWQEIPKPDVICGGYPCQPFSTAGKRRGKEDPRHLWPFVLDAIRELRPRYALMENVRGHLSLGFREVLADLAACGYSAEWQLIPASSVGAPHRRDRVFFVAYTDDAGSRTSRSSLEREGSTRVFDRNDSFDGLSGRRSVLADADGRRLEERKPEAKSEEVFSLSSQRARDMGNSEGFVSDGSRSRQSEELSTLPKAKIHLSETRGRLSTPYSTVWETEPDVGRVAHGVSARVDRLRGLGNAVVPQVADFVGRKIMEFEATQVQ